MLGKYVLISKKRWLLVAISSNFVVAIEHGKEYDKKIGIDKRFKIQ